MEFNTFAVIIIIIIVVVVVSGGTNLKLFYSGKRRNITMQNVLIILQNGPCQFYDIIYIIWIFRTDPLMRETQFNIVSGQSVGNFNKIIHRWMVSFLTMYNIF